MVLSNKLSKKSDSDFILSGASLSKSSQVKDLDVMSNSTLSFTFHINDIVAKAKTKTICLKSVLQHALIS